ncbi:hypothetical protein N7471_012344 [Penicillium samsonianum]|uniref:uncharacterized protein n=1 Tax=Penicillium samsonianum TaxID=1882272 RepID=UPI002547A283|nr:uncharacterized protein N7471_012344 [Penicillium samsonianum]KAJ6125027.1 hypothetical protein N7471_012344 [Penicillium samsonianum]
MGKACGTLIASELELSFWGGVNPQTGEIIDRHHAFSGYHLQDTVLAIPGGRGSCSGSGVILELLLNNKGPSAIILGRRDDILILGVMVAEEMFGKSIPIITLNSEDFQKALKLGGRKIYVEGGHVSERALNTKLDSHWQKVRKVFAQTIELSEIDRAFLEGAHGEAARIAIRIILRMAELQGANGLMDVTQVHVDGCVFTGPGSLLFAERLRDLGGKVRVPTSLNSVSIDLKRWALQGVETAFGEAAAKLANAYCDMGCLPTFTCAPYQLQSAPKRGEQVAWAESNAVVYANSVLGAKTMKYPDFLDIFIALTGRVPRGGPHIEINRMASLVVRVPRTQIADNVDDSFFPILGYFVGSVASDKIPVVVGIESLAPSKDDLKAFGAAFATMSSAPMFHIVGITPEASVLDAVLDKGPHVRFIDVQIEQLVDCWYKLNTAPKHLPVDLISFGNPHFSFTEIKKLAQLCRGRVKSENIKVVVTCGRSSYGLARQAGFIEELESFGVEFMTDTCWCMIAEPIIQASTSAIMTNSGKYAHYGPGLTGRRFFFRSLAICVETACCSKDVGGMPQWLLNAT